MAEENKDGLKIFNDIASQLDELSNKAIDIDLLGSDNAVRALYIKLRNISAAINEINSKQLTFEQQEALENLKQLEETTKAVIKQQDELNKKINFIDFGEKSEEAKSFYEILTDAGYSAASAFEATASAFKDSYEALSPLERKARELVDSLINAGMSADEVNAKLAEMAKNGEFYHLYKKASEYLETTVKKQEELNNKLAALDFTKKGEEAKTFYNALIESGVNAYDAIKYTETAFKDAFVPLKDTELKARELVAALANSGMEADTVAALIEKIAANHNYPAIFMEARDVMKEQVKEQERVTGEQDKTKEKTTATATEMKLLFDTTQKVAEKTKETSKEQAEQVKKLNESNSKIEENVDALEKVNEGFKAINETIDKLSGKLDTAFKDMKESIVGDLEEINSKMKTTEQAADKVSNAFYNAAERIGTVLDRLAFVKEDIKWLEEKSKHLIIIRVEVDYHHSDSGMVRKLANSG